MSKGAVGFSLIAALVLFYAYSWYNVLTTEGSISLLDAVTFVFVYLGTNFFAVVFLSAFTDWLCSSRD